MNQTANRSTHAATPAASAANIVSLRRVLRDNITAESLRQVASTQRGQRGKIQRDRLRRLAAYVEQEHVRGW